MQEVESADELIKKVSSGYQKKEMIAWAGLLRDKKQMIGTCGFNRIDHQNLRAEIGGELLIDYWGKNIAIEAVEKIIEFGFDGMKLNAIEAKVNPSNKGAVFILEKLNFDREGYFKKYGYYNNSFHDLAVYTKFKA